MVLPISSLRQHIEDLANKQPEKTALAGLDETGKIAQNISYKELAEKIDAAATYFESLKVKPGDRVALAFKNSPELLILSWAAWALGIVTVPMDTKRDTGEQYQYKLKLNEAKVLIAQKGALKNIEPEFLNEFNVVEFDGLHNQGETLIEWKEGLDHLSLILFTSGTTGHPKGAKLSLKNLIVNADGIREWLRIEEKDTFLVVLPLHHINSTTFCLSTLLAGGTIAIVPQYSNSNFWNAVAGGSATITSVVQSIIFDQLNREAEYKEVKVGVHLQRIQIGSAPVIAQSVQEFRKKYQIDIYQGYGQTETALRVTGVPMGLSKDLYEKMIEENSIGTPMKWADLQIADADGKFLGEGEEGELVVKGPAIMEGYVAGEKAFGEQGDAKGYFLTGDVGFYREIDGMKFYTLKGRKREIIIKGGVNISPIAVENALKKISPEIDQVHVVAVPDERYGEETGAVISWKKGVDEAAAKRRLKCSLLWGTPYLSAYETPKYLTTMRVEELPMTSTGKVQRSVLKEKLPYERWESIYGLIKTGARRFSALHRYSRWALSSWELYNRCWSPLTVERIEYEKKIPKQLILLAAEKDDTLSGQIALIRTSLSAEQLLRTTYDELLTSKVVDAQGGSLICISICSADYKARPIPVVDVVPSPEDVRAYIPQDPVMKFHAREKGGGRGARLVDVIQGGRPEDKSSLGYNMLLEYDVPKEEASINLDAPVSDQLIEVVLTLARDLGMKHVYAYSRPGGLAHYLAKKG